MAASAATSRFSYVPFIRVLFFCLLLPLLGAAQAVADARA